MLRDRRLRDVEARREVLHRRFAARERLEDRPAAGIRQRLEDLPFDHGRAHHARRISVTLCVVKHADRPLGAGGMVLRLNLLSLRHLRTRRPLWEEPRRPRGTDRSGIELRSASVYPIGRTIPTCGPFGIPSTSRWTDAAIIVQCSRTKSCTVARPRTSSAPMPFSLAG